MANWNTGSVSAAVLRALRDIPSDVSGATLDEWVELARIQLNNYTGQSIPSGTAIPESLQPVVFHYSCAHVLANMLGLGIDYNVSLGDFSVNGGGDSREAQMMKYHLDAANLGMRVLGRKVAAKQTFF